MSVVTMPPLKLTRIVLPWIRNLSAVASRQNGRQLDGVVKVALQLVGLDMGVLAELVVVQANHAPVDLHQKVNRVGRPDLQVPSLRGIGALGVRLAQVEGVGHR